MNWSSLSEEDQGYKVEIVRVVEGRLNMVDNSLIELFGWGTVLILVYILALSIHKLRSPSGRTVFDYYFLFGSSYMIAVLITYLRSDNTVLVRRLFGGSGLLVAVGIGIILLNSRAR